MSAVKVRSQADVNARQSAEDETYRKRTVAALEICRQASSDVDIMGRPCGIYVPLTAPYWQREAKRHACNPFYLAALEHQAAALGIRS